MVFVKSQDVKLKRMEYHDPFLWGNVLKGLYFFYLYEVSSFSIFNINMSSYLKCKTTIQSGHSYADFSTLKSEDLTTKS